MECLLVLARTLDSNVLATVARRAPVVPQHRGTGTVSRLWMYLLFLQR